MRNMNSKLKPSRKYSDKKNAGIVIVNEWLALKHVNCPVKIKKMFENTAKKDDLCDSMMIAVSWVQMMANAKRFLEGSLAS